MAIQQEHPVPIDISDELRTSFMDYAMSVIISRALPDVRDGLKPVHRRILATMRDLNLTATRSYRKCAKIAGDVSGNYHPHGESVVYPSLVRMAQDFSLRYPLIDGQGNFGCFTGDTKIKLLDGMEKSFAELAELGPDAVFHVYSVDSNGRIVVGEGRNARITRHKARIIELTLDNSEKIRCTPDHRFLLRSGTYKQAQDLTLEDSLMPGYFDTAAIKDGLNEYLRVYQPTSEGYEFVHRLADEFNAKQGIAREMRGAFVRHHKNFNRWDNRPTNIERLDFLEHLHLHREYLETLWKDEAFREAQRQGVQRYYEMNPEVLEERRERFIRQNQDEAFRVQNGRRISAGLKQYYQDDPEACVGISRCMKALWEDPEYRIKMSAALANVEKRTLTLEDKARVAAIISERSRAMWGNEAKRDEIVKAIVRAMASEDVRARVSEGVRRKWQDPEYRAKYSEEHFSRMAHAMWEDPAARERHREKITGQWEDEAFREVQRRGVQRSNARRMQNNPHMMAEVAAHASKALMEKWATPEYKQRVMRQKIARYGSRLLAQVGRENFTPEQYEAHRDATWIPRLDTALEYFGDWHELVDTAQKYNHRVVSIEWLDETADVYDITVDEHHNFLLASGVFVHNSIDGDPPAAMRYTEARMTRIGEEMLRDITKNTVDYAQNYDGTREEPVVLPSAIPNLLVNGSSGIAVGMATNIPPHNLAEVVDALLLQLERPECLLQELVELLPGPDFPTGGTIHGHQGIRDAYRTGRGFLQLRARCTIEESKRQDRESIIVTEIPYQVNKTKLLERIAEMVRAKKIEGVADLRDESDREGMRIVLDLKRDAMPQVVLNQLYANTQLQSTFGVIMLALVDNEPRVLPLKDMLSYFLEHRREVVVRRTHYDLERAREREHILAGLMVALDHLDPVIQLIRGASSPAEARQELVTRLGLSETQAQAILDLRLQRLTGLERDKILQEHTELQETITEFEAILSSEARIQEIIKDELLELKEQYGDARRTDIIEAEEEINREDLIVEEDMVVTKSHGGYIKRQPISLYQNQRRGGKGKVAMQTNEEDFVEQLFVASTHDYLLFFTNIGKVHWLKVYEIPQAGRTAKGRAAVNLLQLQPGEQISTVVPIRRFEVDRYLIMATKHGIVKKTELTAYGNPRQGGIIALTLDDDDELIRVGVTHGDQDIFLGTRQGYSLRFNEADARPIGRTARGVIGIRLEDGDEVIGMEVLSPDSTILTVSAGGYGKRTDETEYRVQGRGGKGLINLNVTAKTGPVVGVLQVFDDDDVMVMSDQGNLVRLPVADVRRIGRNTQGVRLINLTSEQRLIGVVRIAEDNARPGMDAASALEDAAAESAELDTDAETLADPPESDEEPEDSPDAESYN